MMACALMMAAHGECSAAEPAAWTNNYWWSAPADTTLCNAPYAQIVHPWAGKRVGFIGDSITDPNCYSYVKKYWAFLHDWLGLTPYVYGISGRKWDDAQRQAEQLKKEHGDDVDAIMIFLGTNDFNAGIPVGEWYTESEEQVEVARREEKHLVTRKMRIPVMDNATLKGRINKALSSIKSMYPDKQIVLLTPIHRSTAMFGNKNVQPNERYQNSCGEYFDAYVNAVKEAGNVWGVTVIDLNADCGLNPMVEEQVAYFRDAETDRLHPGTAGQERMARSLMYRLLSVGVY
jgi:lysophospholipase L1-like esterase